MKSLWGESGTTVETTPAETTTSTMKSLRSNSATTAHRGTWPLGGTNPGRGKPAALRFPAAAGSREVVWSSATDPGKWCRRRPWPASSRPPSETARQRSQGQTSKCKKWVQPDKIFSLGWSLSGTFSCCISRNQLLPPSHRQIWLVTSEFNKEGRPSGSQGRFKETLKALDVQERRISEWCWPTWSRSPPGKQSFYPGWSAPPARGCWVLVRARRAASGRWRTPPWTPAVGRW